MTVCLAERTDRKIADGENASEGDLLLTAIRLLRSQQRLAAHPSNRSGSMIAAQVRV